MTGKRQTKQLERALQMLREEKKAYLKAGGAPRSFKAHFALQDRGRSTPPTRPTPPTGFD